VKTRSMGLTFDDLHSHASSVHVAGLETMSGHSLATQFVTACSVAV
jgi:hypothetical protein